MMYRGENRTAGRIRMTLARLTLTLACAAAAGLFAPPAPAIAQTYPDKSVRIVIAFPAGGSIDTLGRILSQKMSELWGQSVVVENRPGAGGNIGAAAAAQAAPDGYTLHLGAQTLAVNVTIAPYQGLNPMRDFEPIALVATAQDVLMVAPDSPYKSVKDLVDDAKRRPGQLNYASLGPGSSAHLATVLFSEVTGIKLQHVPYPTGMAQAVADIVSGRISLWLATLGGAFGNIQAGKVRALAVSGVARAEALPNIPTFREQGIAMEEESTWFGFFAPKGTPKAVIAKVNADLQKILALPDVKARGVTLGYRFIGGPPEKLAEHLSEQTAKWAQVAKSANLAAR
jgi:tripartite-type tricarboxylate transporter receptor subunit TctC